MPAGWRQSSVGSSTPAAELPAVVATKDYFDRSFDHIHLDDYPYHSGLLPGKYA